MSKRLKIIFSAFAFLWVFVPTGLGQTSYSWPGEVVEFLALESGYGIRWEPSEREASQFVEGLDRPLEDHFFNIAPFAASDSEEVHSETLAWLILAELEWAEQLKQQASPRALVFAYLMAKQVQFATSQLKDEGQLLYVQRWQEDASIETSFRVEDQVLMLWALSAYSANIDYLIQADNQSGDPGDLLKRFTSPLADELFSTLLSRMESTLNDWLRDPMAKRMWLNALQTYLEATSNGLLQQQAQGLFNALLREVEQELAAPEFTNRENTLNLESLMQMISLLNAQLRINQSVSASALRNFDLWQSHPGARTLLRNCPACASGVRLDDASNRWASVESTFQTTPVIAAAYYLLEFQPKLSEIRVLGFGLYEVIDDSVSRLMQRLDQLSLGLEEITAASQAQVTSSIVSQLEVVSKPTSLPDSNNFVWILAFIFVVLLGWLAWQWMQLRPLT